MTDNIKDTHFHYLKFDLKGHIRSHKALLCLKIVFFLNIYFCLHCNFIKTININNINTQISHEVKYDLIGHRESHKALLANFFLAHSFINRFAKDLLNTRNMKT